MQPNAKAHRSAVRPAARRLRAELRLEGALAQTLEAAPAWDTIHGYLPPRNETRGAA